MNFITEDNRIYMNDETGKLLAEITFPKTKDNEYTIDHTFVIILANLGQGSCNMRTAFS